MKWTIIIIVMMSLIGSMMWVMPTKRQRFQAQLRQQAMRMGFSVQIAQVQPPRASGELEKQSFNMPVYRLPRMNMNRSEREAFVNWQVYKQQALASEGLPDGWCWGEGERSLSETQLEMLNNMLQQLPESARAVESDPVHLSVYWGEEGDSSDLEKLMDTMNVLITEKL